MLLYMLGLANAVSIDSLGIGVTYGVRDIKITILPKIIISIISIVITTFGLLLGHALINIFSESIANLIGAVLLIAMGIWIIKGSFSDNKKETMYIGEKGNTEKTIMNLLVKSMGITIKIIKNPENSDLDKSKYIDVVEAIYLGIALSIDGVGAMIASSAIGMQSVFLPIIVCIFQIFFLTGGIFLGQKIKNKSKINNKIWPLISGVILTIIGVLRIM